MMAGALAVFNVVQPGQPGGLKSTRSSLCHVPTAAGPRSCSCGEKSLSADRRDHWADVMITSQKKGEVERYSAVSQGTPERWRELREVIFYAVDEEAKHGEQSAGQSCCSPAPLRNAVTSSLSCSPCR